MTAFTYVRHDSFTLTLLGLAVVLLVARLMGLLFERLRQPPVIGEVIGGLALGPSLLGSTSHRLFPLESRPLLRMLATLGVVLFMFLVGLELDLGELTRRRRRVAAGVAISGTVIPFALGFLSGFALYRNHRTHAEFLPFALFLGAAMSITAFPVLARILEERGLWDKPLGALAMACAAGDDVLTWATLTFVVAIVGSTTTLEMPYVCGAACAFALVAIRVIRPWMRRFRDFDATPTAFALAVGGLLAFSYGSSAIGVHEIAGAFLWGAVLPRGRLQQGLRRALVFPVALLLPVFFVTTGLNVDVGGIHDRGALELALLLVVACSGKLLGAVAGARSQGLAVRESIGLGVLMNTRGLTELIVLNVGREMGILDQSLFTLLVVVAVITTVATGPLLSIVRPDPWLGRSPTTTPQPDTATDVPLMVVS